jgi:ABC-type multidrug transport system fused ATPase/permease subunit
VIVADVSFIDLFWSILWFYFIFVWLMILFHILSDLFSDHSLSGVAKTLWVLFLVFLPFVAALVYMFSRGQGMAERSAARQRRAQEQFAGHVRDVAGNGATAPTEQIARAKELLDAGTIDQSEFDRLKAKALA